MAYCPNCNVVIAKDAVDCDVCGTSFGSDSWLPLDAPPGNTLRPALARLILTLGVAAVLLPLVALLLGAVIQLVVPGCECEPIAGCQGCGLNDLTAFLLRSGREGSLLALLCVFPAAALLAGLLNFWPARRA
jgi:hypothetical protein